MKNLFKTKSKSSLLTVVGMLLLLSQTSIKHVSAEDEEGEEFEDKLIFGSDVVSRQVWQRIAEVVPAEQQYKWGTQEGVVIENEFSNKTVIEIGVDDHIKNGDGSVIKTSYEFWTKKAYMNVTQLDNEKITLTENYFEFQGQANLKNVDVTDWVAGDIVQFRAGMHTTRTDRDWSIIQFKYPGQGVASTISDFTCTDGYSQVRHSQTWSEQTINMDEFQNCQCKNNDEGSSKITEYEVDGRTMADITTHFVKPFRSEYPGEEDIAITEGEPLGLQLSVEWKDQLRQTGTTIMIANPMASWEIQSGSVHLAMSALIVLVNAMYFL